MGQGQELDRLEGFVSRLLAAYNEMKEKNDKLMVEISNRNETINTLQRDLSVVDKERSDVSNRIKDLVGKIEYWEAELKNDEVGLGTSDDTNSGVQGSLFTLNSDNTDVVE